MAAGFPRASWSNLQASTPIVQLGVSTAAGALNSVAAPSLLGDANSLNQAASIGHWLFNGTNWDRARSGSGDAAASTGLQNAAPLIFNGATYDRLRTVTAGNNTTGAGVLGAAVLGWDGTNYVRIFATTPGDGVTNSQNPLETVARNAVYNGSTWDRLRANSAATLSGATQGRGLLTANPGEWTAFHTPAVSTQATATKAAGGASVRHVCRSICYTHDAVAAQTAITINLRDGATGAGALLWSKTIKLAIAAQPLDVNIPGLNIFGSANTAMTLEFSGAPVATNTQSVAMTGYSV